MSRNLRERKRLRLKAYDYAKQGAYFVTVCVFEKMRIFGEIVDTKMCLNDWGMDEYVIMPNYMHGIIFIDNIHTGRACPAPTTNNKSPSLSTIIGSFKSATTKHINELRGSHGMTIWHRSFHDRVIRDECELNDIRQYIEYNPQDWTSDNENPNA